MSFLFNYLSLIWWCNRNSILLFFYTISKEPHRGKISLFICSFGLFCQRVSHMDLPLVGLTCFLFEIVVTLQQHSTVCVCVSAHEDGEFHFFIDWKRVTFQQRKLSSRSFPVVIYFVLTFMWSPFLFQSVGLFAFFGLRFIFLLCIRLSQSCTDSIELRRQFCTLCSCYNNLKCIICHFVANQLPFHVQCTYICVRLTYANGSEADSNS